MEKINKRWISFPKSMLNGRKKLKKWLVSQPILNC